MDLAHALREDGYAVVGPARTCGAALDLLKSHEVEAAILDFIIGDENCGPVADELDRREIPWALTSGYDLQVMPPRFRRARFIAKPFEQDNVLDVVRDLVGVPAQKSQAAGR